MILLQKHFVQIFCRNDGTIGWAPICELEKSPTKMIKWSSVEGVEDPTRTATCSNDIPLIIATVNSPHYRSRLVRTLDSLSSPCQDGTKFHPICIDMLKLDECPSIGVNRIVFEGWRQILLPAILDRRKQTESTNNNELDSIIFIAEDDVRLSNSPGRIRDVCIKVFDSNPDLQILSLGHRHARKKPSRRQRRRAKREQSHSHSDNVEARYQSGCNQSSLLNHLNGGGKIHGSTFLAIRYPSGITSLLDAMEAVPCGKRSHFDQFLFHSTMHEIGIAFSAPSLAGWAETDETLTSVSNGFRRVGGGRLEFRPDAAEGYIKFKWVQRRIAVG